MVIDGPANVVVKTGKVPIIGTPVKAGEAEPIQIRQRLPRNAVKPTNEEQE